MIPLHVLQVTLCVEQKDPADGAVLAGPVVLGQGVVLPLLEPALELLHLELPDARLLPEQLGAELRVLPVHEVRLEHEQHHGLVLPTGVNISQVSGMAVDRK